MPAVSFCFRIHQPFQFKHYAFNDIGHLHSYEDKVALATIMDNLADNCYLPANKILLDQIKTTNGKFRFAFAISGTTLELFEQYRPDLIKSFRQLTDTGCVEILGETYYNSLSWLHSKKEFDRQVKKHECLVKEIFGVAPSVFCNTELIYDNELVKHIASKGYIGIISEGVHFVLNGRTPNQIYAAPNNGDFGVLLRNSELSNDIAGWIGKAKGSRYALTADKFAYCVFQNFPQESCSINLFIDYETFGIHKTPQTGIFNFLNEIPAAILSNKNYSFKTPAEVLDHCYPVAIYDVPSTTSLAGYDDYKRIWEEQIVQNTLIKKLYKLEELVSDCADEQILNTWGKLQSVDHFSFLQGYHRNKGEIYQTKKQSLKIEENCNQYRNILTDFEILLINTYMEKRRNARNSRVRTLLF